MKYQVRINGTVEATYNSKAKAIADAKVARETIDGAVVIVVAHERSGTYESRTCIWPVRGETYTN